MSPDLAKMSETMSEALYANEKYSVHCGDEMNRCLGAALALRQGSPWMRGFNR